MRIDLAELSSEFATGLAKVAGLMLGSFTSLQIANALPDEATTAKVASSLSGWALAIVTIWTLAKVVKHLFQKLETRDDKIVELYRLITEIQNTNSSKRIKELEDEINDLEKRKS
jgi:hypothetical protein